VNARTLIIAICFAALIGVPLLFRPSGASSPRSGDALGLIIITPHNEQIRYEFGRGFEAWHQRKFGRPVHVIFNVPGGTSEIRKMLEAQFLAALESGDQPGGEADLVFGGGSYEHDQLGRTIEMHFNDVKRQTSITVPINFEQSWLDATYGENRIGGGLLYDPDRHWFGVALSGFGIVFNRDLLQQLNVPEPDDWSDLADARLQGWVALVNPGQSGSIKTTFESILQRRGWIDGWRILRRAAANARYFSGSSLKPPIDVSQGNAAMGVCIDFFGRFQSQALKEAGDAQRVGYVDPAGGSTIDSDPISVLRNAPHPELAKRFIEFCLSDEGQALWQFHRRSGQNKLGPLQFELRRLPIVRSMYQRHFEQFADKVNPFEIATAIANADPNYRDFIAPMFSAMAMDNHEELKQAWASIASHPSYPADTAEAVVTAPQVIDPDLQRMLELFDALPSIDGPDGAVFQLADPASLAQVRSGWIRGQWVDGRLWNRETSPGDAMRQRFGAFFRENYRQIVEISGRSQDAR
jgi:iron(III) transport system substrate-binding protein